jgi:hypothetical protein
LISQDAQQAITSSAGVKQCYLAGNQAAARDTDAVRVADHSLEQLRMDAQKRCNIRDYVTSLVEQTILRLTLDIGPPPTDILDLARAVNPFLNRREDDATTSSQAGPSGFRAGHENTFVAPFRLTDIALISEAEQDLLVLLYFCDITNLRSSPDEVVDQINKMATKYGTIKNLDLRKEPFSETEVGPKSKKTKRMKKIYYYSPLLAYSSTI